MLWDQGATSFLPHGVAGGTDDARQPILLSTSADAPNLARNMLIADGQWRDAALTTTALLPVRRCTLEGARLAGSCWRAATGSSGVTGRRKTGKWVSKA